MSPEAAPREAVALYYDDSAPSYVAGWRTLEHYSPLVAEFLLDAVVPGCRLLDVGCGPGQLTAELPPDVAVTGFDVSPGMLAAARARRPGGRYEQHDLHDPLPDGWGPFDVVLAVGCLEFCHDLPATLRHLAAACAPGARLLVGVVEDRRAPAGRSREAFSDEGLPAVAMHAYDTTAQLAAITTAGLSPWTYRFVPAWRHDEYARTVRYGLWELRADGGTPGA